MGTKRIIVEFEEVKVLSVWLDLKDLENYMSKFLALKNHERETSEILEVRGVGGSNKVHVVMLIDDYEDEEKYVMRCIDFLEQFGPIDGKPEIETAYILSEEYNGLSTKLDYKEMYLYR